MSPPQLQIPVYLEIGKRRIFAAAIDWPGWCRSARDPEAALEALIDLGGRYARVLARTRLGFQVPEDSSPLVITERLTGNASTDFGAPAIPPAADAQSLDASELRRHSTILRACWRAFDGAVEQAMGRELRKGPRGGGRELDAIVEHVLGADEAYLSRVGSKPKLPEDAEPADQLRYAREAILEAVNATAHVAEPEPGPRGGVRWTARYLVRRVAWHVLDHTWEIEDRLA